ncbi:PAAR domain-containing protein [Enterobacter hormaechei]|uniref:PAAR domain-containing protein n=1 Tax=Enterobacter hormaechei TaxID=158836 RepID=UPI0020236EE8|nr:PAAR domain-containing protein [Enterobacter hormaechei]MCL8356413.1 alanine racemase [Enterobacter hormaechei subsp. xiangfangensis]
MSAIATKNSIGTGHGGFPARPPIEGESLLKINGIDVLVDGNQYAQHSDGNSTHGGQAISTRQWFTVNGKGVVCVGDPISCGSTVAAGDSLVQIS